jgi:photosystem II oxygen-evolving enhancer protein 1
MLRAVTVLCVLVGAFGFKLQMKNDFNKVVASAMAGIFAASSINMPAQALTKAEVLSLSYEQVKGSGLANRCPEVATGKSSTIALSTGKKYKVTDLCLEPTNWQVEEEVGIKKGKAVKEFVNTKLMTRQTYSLDGVSGTVEVKDGSVVFTEEDGIDYAATTVQVPGGERVPFLFSIKNLVAKSSTAGPIAAGFDLGGSFTVPSYRTGLFLDPKGRGTTTGYDFAGALPGLQNSVDGGDELFNENNKRFDVLKGDIEFAVNKVNGDEGEFGGVFVSKQPSDTDMGGKSPKDILIKGIFYGHVEPL